MTKELFISQVRIDGGTQTRVICNSEAVAEYAEVYKADIKMPAITVFFDGSEYWLADGFHRLLAAQQAGRKHITATVHKGTKEEAAWAACAANQGHGIRRTNADKRRAVEMAIKLHPELSARQIADHCGVSKTIPDGLKSQVAFNATCTQVVAPQGSISEKQPKTMPPPPTRVIGKDGKSYPASTPKAAKRIIKDEVGRVIPEDLIEFWNRRDELAPLFEKISEVKCIVEKAKAKRDLLFETLHYNDLMLHLEAAYFQLKQARPYVVCGICQGHKCKVCVTGFMTKASWEMNVPRETREMIKRDCK